MNPRTRELDGELLRAAGVDASLFARRVMPGERVGVLRDEVARRTGLGRVEVFAVAGHDTASAIAAVPAADECFAYLSSARGRSWASSCPLRSSRRSRAR